MRSEWDVEEAVAIGRQMVASLNRLFKKNGNVPEDFMADAVSFAWSARKIARLLHSENLALNCALNEFERKIRRAFQNGELS